VISPSVTRVKKEVYDAVLQLVELGGIDNTGNFVGVEHSFHGCVEECDGDATRDFLPEVISGEFLDPFWVILFIMFTPDRIDLN